MIAELADSNEANEEEEKQQKREKGKEDQLPFDEEENRTTEAQSLTGTTVRWVSPAKRKRPPKEQKKTNQNPTQSRRSTRLAKHNPKEGDPTNSRQPLKDHNQIKKSSEEGGTEQ